MYWLARLLQALGLHVVLTASFGGETGRVLSSLLEEEAFEVHPVEVAGSNGVYVHDRRSGDRVEVADMSAASLTRHDVDDLYGASVAAGLDASVCVLGGPPDPKVITADVYRRLARDLRRNGKKVVADLSSGLAEAVLAGGVTLLKISDQELPEEERSRGIEGLVEVMMRMARDGADSVILSRAEKPVLALIEGKLVEACPPTLEVVDERGGGDSLTAGMAAALARGADLPSALRLGVAAGSLNVTRRGLGSGKRGDIERLARRVELHPIEVPNMEDPSIGGRA